MTGQHYAQKSKTPRAQHFKEQKRNRKPVNILLSVIALIEIILTITSMTFAWFEGITSLQMEGNNIPTASALKSEFIIGEGPDYEDTTAELNQFFEAQANAKFTPVSSFDGEHFYALYSGSATSNSAYTSGVSGKTLKFRELSQEEINSNLLYLQFELTAKDADTTFWFKEMPSFYINGNRLDDDSNPFRIRIDDGDGDTASSEGNLIITTKPTWPSSNRANMKAIKSIDSTTGYATLNTGTGTEAIANRAIYKVFNKTNNFNKNGSQVLFTVPKDQTKTITIAVWLEAFDQAYNETQIPPGANVKVDIKFCSSWDVMDTITFRDYTASQWVDSVNEGESNASQILGVVNLDSPSNYWYSGFTYNATTHVWTGEIPRAVQNLKFIWQTTGTNTEDNKWPANTRGTNTTYTAFGSNGTGLWYDGDVERIGFSDATTDRWLNNNSPKMRVNIKYSGYTFNYSMTDSPSLFEGTNTWFCYIPKDLDEVRFNRCDKDNTAIIHNYWLGPGRGEETIYYALESGEDVFLPDETGTTVYLRVPTAYENQFFDQNRLPAVSIMSQANIDLVTALGNNKQNLAQNGGYVVDGSAHADKWLGDQGRMTKITTTDGSHLYSFHFDEELEDGTYLTFWNKPQVNYSNLDNRTCIAPLIKYESDKNVYILWNPKQLTNGTFNNAWIFDCNGINEDIDETTGGTTTTQPEQQNGRWGKPTKPNGTYTTYFVPPTTASPTTVTATFAYEYFGYTVTLTDADGDGIFETNGIPDGVTAITFSDGTHTWEAGSGRTSTNNYFVCSSTSAGAWKSSAATGKTLRVGVIYYLKERNTINQVYYWTDTGNGTINLADLTPTEKNYSVGSSYWTGTAQKFYCYEITVPEDVVGIKFKNSSNQWFGGDVKNFEDGKIDLIFEYSNVYHNYRTTY